MRAYSINLAGRVKNFSLPKNRPLVPLYEAIVNSLHAIEERRLEDTSFKNGRITIDLKRSPQLSLKDTELLPVVGFTVTDNGIGFNECNMRSFLESDSTYKSGIGGKGVGRFSWLKTFSYVSIISIFKDRGTFVKREFVFTLSDPYIDDTLTECEDARDHLTSVTLDTYLPEYSKDVPKQIDTIAARIIQHCLVYFLDENCPEIIIRDENASLNLNQLFMGKFKTEDNTTEFQIKGMKFTLLNVKIEERTFQGNCLYLCANNRLVDSRDLERKIVDLDSQIFDRNNFWYVGVLTSQYLDEHVDMNRLSFSIPESGTNIFDEVTLEEIINKSCYHIEEYLDEFLRPITEDKLKRIQEYVTTSAPQYRHLLKYMPDQIANIKPNLSGDKLDDALHETKRRFDKEAKSEQKALLEKLEKSSIDDSEYELYFLKQFQKISDANSSALAEYVAHRRVIIDLFEVGLRRQGDGKFNKEKYMHDLIYPMRSSSEETNYEAHNLWLVDEKISYCTFISSDIPFDNDPKQERSDLLILDHPVAVADNKNDGTVFDTIIIFELKRPMRDDYTDSDNPITQLYDYVRKIREGQARDKNHRLIKVNDSTKFYLYAICDVTGKLERLLDERDFTRTPDMLGYYNFNKKHNAYFEILSYDKIIHDAKKRNRVLFDKLGI